MLPEIDDTTAENTIRRIPETDPILFANLLKRGLENFTEAHRPSPMATMTMARLPNREGQSIVLRIMLPSPLCSDSDPVPKAAFA